MKRRIVAGDTIIAKHYGEGDSAVDLKEYCGYLERRIKELEEENILLETTMRPMTSEADDQE